MTTTSRRGRFILYGVVIAVAAMLIVIGLAVRRSAKSDQVAQQKADQLIAALTAAGARTPSRDEVIRLFGDDGGAVCAGPSDALRKAALLAGLGNGAAGPGARPVIAAGRLVRGEVLVISIYCPDKLAEFQQFVDQLKTVQGG
jgi:Tfp pilus assembly protein FimT